jgi:hypothetical protein
MVEKIVTARTAWIVWAACWLGIGGLCIATIVHERIARGVLGGSELWQRLVVFAVLGLGFTVLLAFAEQARKIARAGKRGDPR